MKLSRKVKYELAGLGIVLVLVIGLLVYAARSPSKVGPAHRGDPTACEFCRKNLNKNGECPSCIQEMGLEKYRAKREANNQSALAGPLIPSVLASLLGLLLVVYIAIILWNRVGKRKAEVFFHVHCNKCGRKMRYRESQIGHMGKCPLCQKPILFPKPPEVPKGNRWRNVIQLRKIARTIWG